MGVSSGCCWADAVGLRVSLRVERSNPSCDLAGRVERSDTHQYCACGDGFRFALPILRGEAIQLVACSPDERSDIRGGVRVVPDVASLIRATPLNMRRHSRGTLRPRFA